jgi:GH24 family phage-related lysozyme (muramidase)
MLTSIQAKADPVLKAAEKRAAEREYAEGQALYEKTRKSLGDAVRDGVIEEGASPYLRKGYRVSNLNILSNKFATELDVALNAKQLYKNGNPAAAEAYARKFAEDFASKNNIDGFTPQEVAEYFLPNQQKASAAFISSWRTKNITWQRDQNYIKFGEEVGEFSNTLFSDTDTPEQRELKQLTFGNWLTNKIAQAETDGMDRSRINSTMANNILITALENKDASILDVFDRLKVGTGFMGNSAEIRQKVLTTTNSIEAMIAADEKEVADQRKARIEADVAQAERNALEASISAFNGNDDAATQALDESIAIFKATGESDKARTWIKFKREMAKAGASDRNDDGAALAELNRDLEELTDPSEVVKRVNIALEQETISFETANSIITRAQNRVTDGNKLVPYDFSQSSNGVKITFDGFLNQLDVKDVLGNSDEGLISQARETIYEDYRQWFDGFPKDKPPSRSERRAEARRIVNDAKETFTFPSVQQDTAAKLEEIREARNPTPKPPPPPQPDEPGFSLFRWLESYLTPPPMPE